MTAKAGANFLSYGHQTVEDDDIAAVAAALRGDFLTTGPLVGAFEAAFAGRVDAKHVIACSSGTAALHLAVMALGIGSGDAVVVPSLTFLATANAVRFTGAEVMFADVNPDTGMLTAETLQTALNSPARDTLKAVVPVHLAGMVADIPGIAEVARTARLAVIEDACHALGAGGPDGKPIGSCAQSRIAAFSTHPVKTITTGEGGVLATNDPDLAARARRLRNHGIEHDPARWTDPASGSDGGQPAPWYYEMSEVGYNYRLTDIACALGLSQLKKLDRFVARRAELAQRYDQLLTPLAPHVKIPARPKAGVPAWHLYAPHIDFNTLKRTRGDVMRRLRNTGIGTQVHYIPVHRQPYYRRRYGEMNLPGADTYYQRILSLPLFPAMQVADVDRVVNALASALGLA